MPINSLNSGAISFKRLSGKAHTQENFAVTEESISSNISLAFTTVFGSSVNPLPITDGGLNTLYATDGKVEKIRFDLEIIPDTLIGTNRSQGYRLKLPVGYTGSGVLGSKFSGGTKLYTALGKLQLVPSLYGTVKPDGTTEYDPILYQTDGLTVIPKFDPINWIVDNYSGILFIQDPPAGYDVSGSRPLYLEAFLYVGDYLDELIASGLTGTSVEWSQIINKPTEFNPTPHTHPISGVTGLQGILDNKINISEKGQPNGVAPLNANNIIPAIHIPTIFKEVYVVADVAARTARFVASGSTPGPGQVESFEGLRVYILDCTGAPELPTGITGSCESIDTNGLLNWSGITSSQTVNNDWYSITNKPPLVNRILNGGGLHILPFSGTGYTTISVDVDNVYIETQVPSGKLSIIEQSIDPSRLKFQGGISGNTGQYIIRGSGNTFQAVDLPFTGVSSIFADSGVTNIGTSENPHFIAEVDSIDGTIETTSLGLKVKNSSIGSNKINFGSAPFQFNADLLVLNTGTTYSGATDVGSAIEELSDRIDENFLLNITGASNVGSGEGNVFVGVSGQTLQFKSIKYGNNILITETGVDIIIEVTGITASTGTTSNITANNGLTKIGDNIVLGGLFTGNTNIDADNYGFNIYNASGITIQNVGVDGFNVNSYYDVSISANTNIDYHARKKINISVGSGSTKLDMDQNKFSVTGSTGWDLIWNKQNKRFIAGDNCQATGGSINYTFGDSNVNAGTFGSALFGELSTIENNVGAAFGVGESVLIRGYGGKAFGRGSRINTNGSFGLVGGVWTPGATNPKTNDKVPQVGGLGAFGFYSTDGSQTDNHGALAAYSVILGGLNHNIPSNSISSAIIGGNGIKVDSGVTNTVHLPKVRIGLGTGGSLATNNTNNNLVVVNSTTGELEIRLASTISGSTGTSSQNVYIEKRIVTGSTSLTGNDFVLLCNAITAVTLTTPSSPIDGQVYKIKDVSGNAGTNIITINGNGKNIDGSVSIQINSNRGGVEIVYDQTLDFWSVMNFVG